MGVKRRYDATRRQAQADATRAAVLDAAGVRFQARGYAATTVDEIAAEAGVSRETIFKAFGAKREVLRRWVERSVAGADEPVPVQEQSWVGQMRAAPDRRRRIEVLVHAVREVHDRSAVAIGVLRAAAHADPEIGALWDEGTSQRRRDAEVVTAILDADGSTRRRRPSQEAVDVVYALTSPELHDLLVRQSGWTAEQFERWVARALALGPSA